MQKPHDSAHSAFMKPTFLPHSPASAHEPHAELESLHGGSCASEREEAPKAASSAKLTRICLFARKVIWGDLLLDDREWRWTTGPRGPAWVGWRTSRALAPGGGRSLRPTSYKEGRPRLLVQHRQEERPVE